MELNETWQEARSQRPLPSLCFSGRSEKQDSRPGLWLAETFLTSPLKLLNGIQQNLIGSKISTSSTKFVFFGPIGKQDGRPGLWLAERFWTSPLKLLNWIQRNLTGSKISTSSTILLPIKFCWIPFSSFRGEVKNVSANQRPGRLSCFSDRPEKHKLGRGRWDLASCQVSLNSIKQFQRRSPKSLSQSEARTAILFSDWPEKHKLGRGRWDLASYQVSLNSIQRFQRRSQKCLSQSEARAAILFSDRPENTNLVEDVEKFVLSGRSEKEDGRPGLWLAETFLTSPLKPLNEI